MATAMDVANYFLAAAPKEDDYLTNLKLQKLCAYAQAVSLAYVGKPLFDEELEAWTHGPVVPTVYMKFKANGSNAIPPCLAWDDAIESFNEDERYILQMTWAAYGRFTAWALRDLSHWDFPGDFGSRAVIPQEQIKDAFEKNTLVNRMRSGDKLAEGIHGLDI